MITLPKINIGDVVRLSEPMYPYSPSPPDLGLVVEWMRPFAKSLEPYGLYRILWSGNMEYLNGEDELSEDLWISPEDLEVVVRNI